MPLEADSNTVAPPSLFAELPLAEPPRYVPTSLWLRMHLGGTFQAGTLFFAVGMAFVAAVTPMTDISALWQFRGELERAPGGVIESGPINVTFNDYRMYKYVCGFRYEGQRYEIVSYATPAYTKISSNPDVEFPKGRPELARIVGANRRPFAAIATQWLWLFPLFGGAIMVSRLLSGRRAVRLLRVGRLTMAERRSHQRLKLERWNSQPLRRYVFEYMDEFGDIYQHSTVTNSEAAEEVEKAPLLYDPSQPRVAMILANTPEGFDVDEAGQPRPVPWALALLIAPTVSVAACVWLYFAMTNG